MIFGVPSPVVFDNFTAKPDIIFESLAPVCTELNFSFPNPSKDFIDSQQISLNDLSADNLTSTIDKILDKYGKRFPHMEQARQKGFKYTKFTLDDPRFPESFKNVMKTARAATNPSAREIIFNIDNISSYASQTGRSLEKQLVLTLSNEACHVLWGTSVETRSDEKSKIELDEVFARHNAKDITPTKLETDIIDRTYDEFISSVVMRITEVCLEDENKRIKFEEFVRTEKSFLDSTLSAHIDSGFFGVFNSETLKMFLDALSRNGSSDEKQKFRVLVDRVNAIASSSSFGQRFIEGIKKANLPIVF
jgi:hypothetical protein